MSMEYYNPTQGLKVISSQESQRYTKRLDSFSSVDSSISCGITNTKFCIDSCWETENTYYANYNGNYVRKIKFDGTVLHNLNLNNASMVSVVQSSSFMGRNAKADPQEDKGCWIVSDNIVKTDNNLNILYETENITNVDGIIADLDEGCYVSGTYGGNYSLIKISSEGIILDVKLYSSFSPIIDSFVDFSIDIDGRLLVVANDKIYPVKYQNGQIESLIAYPMDPISDIPLSGTDLHIGGIDVDRNSGVQHFYCVIGNDSISYVVKYDQDGVLIDYDSYNNISYSYVIKAVQGYGSDSFYVLEDNSKNPNLSSSSMSEENIQIHRILKSNLELQDTIDIVETGMEESAGMTISHYAFAEWSTSSNLPYELEVVKEFIPEIKEVEFAVSVRKTIDLKAIGPNENILKNIGKDEEKTMIEMNDLPPGFSEMYGGT